MALFKKLRIALKEEGLSETREKSSRINCQFWLYILKLLKNIFMVKFSKKLAL